MNVHIVESADPEVRLDKYLVESIGKYSRSSWQKMINSGSVLVNQRVESPDYSLSIGDEITWNTPSTNQKLKLDILFEDADVLVINKSPGHLVHAKNDLANEATIASSISDLTDDTQPGRAGIVHRLDRFTSGVMILAKTEGARVFLQKQFARHTVDKYYLSAIDGKIRKNVEIDLPMARNSKKPQTWEVNAKGKPSKTSLLLLNSRSKHSVVLLKPQTGRTHQIRVHLAHLGHPIIGDLQYQASTKAERFLLHAWQLRITLPSLSSKWFIAPLPTDMSKYIKDEDLKNAQAIITSKHSR